jgi:hypothetical protein
MDTQQAVRTVLVGLGEDPGRERVERALPAFRLGIERTAPL